jgi:polysaccharide deacetylase family protein (PEP-CTERM system associated)
LGEAGVEATFFTLGSVARRHPALARRIVADGHELASHGTDHLRVDRQSPAAFRADIRDSKKILEDIGGVVVNGYRAPTFSIGCDSGWAHAILAEEGYRYSSSVYPVRHDLYGSPDAPRSAFAPVPGLVEIPLTTVRLLGRDIPASGGGYFRLFPYPLTRWLLGRLRSRIRHYLNLSRTEPRLRRLLRHFSWTRMDRLFLSDRLDPYPLIAAWTQARSP